jgi:hypothetical protein
VPHVTSTGSRIGDLQAFGRVTCVLLLQTAGWNQVQFSDAKKIRQRGETLPLNGVRIDTLDRADHPFPPGNPTSGSLLLEHTDSDGRSNENVGRLSGQNRWPETVATSRGDISFEGPRMFWYTSRVETS